MINLTLRKCLGEVEKPEPNISYVREMLETLITMQEPPLLQSNNMGGPITAIPIGISKNEKTIEQTSNDEGMLLDSIAKSQIVKLKSESERMNQ